MTSGPIKGPARIFMPFDQNRRTYAGQVPPQRSEVRKMTRREAQDFGLQLQQTVESLNGVLATYVESIRLLHEALGYPLRDNPAAWHRDVVNLAIKLIRQHGTAEEPEVKA